MKTIKLLPIILLLACTSQEYAKVDPVVLMNVDKEFSNMSDKEGMVEAFIFYADQDVVKLSEGGYPIIGKTNLSDEFSKLDDSQFKLTWEPLKADLAKSGELGYTYGKYFFTAMDSVETTTTGYYISVWKKQDDGSWKYVLDGGSEGPVE